MQEQEKALKAQASIDDSKIGNTTQISAEANENPFLTASEKAIINRASAAKDAPDVNSPSRFSDAVSSFIEKSRRLTYKISP